jgi:hypothetical protein
MQAKKRVKANSSATANVSVRRSATRNRVHDAPPHRASGSVHPARLGAAPEGDGTSTRAHGGFA